MWPSVIVHKDAIYLFGGFSNRDNINLGDLWTSKDGVSWRQIKRPGGPSPRHYATMFDRQDGFLLVAGNAWPVQNDIWLFRSSASSALDEVLLSFWWWIGGK